MIRLPEERREKDIADHAHRRELICDQFNKCLEMKKKAMSFQEYEIISYIKKQCAKLETVKLLGGSWWGHSVD